MDYAKEAQENIILKVRVGSHLFGTTTPDSDLDYDGVFLPNESVLIGLGRCKEVDLGTKDKDLNGRNTKDAIDFKIREYREFVKLALDNNPNILNILFANEENIEFINEYGKRLREMARYFTYDGCRLKYSAYARSQMKKMTIKPENYENIEKAIQVLSQEEDQSEMIINCEAVRSGVYMYLFFDHGSGKHIRIANEHFVRMMPVRKVIRLLQERIDKASHRSKLWKEHGYDTKFGSNLIQILDIGIEMAKTGKVEFPLKSRELILDIKKGKYELAQVIEMGESRSNELDTMDSVLPKKQNYELIDQFVQNEMRRWIRSFDDRHVF